MPFQSLLKRDGTDFSKLASSPASVLKLEEISALVEGEVALQSGSKWEATDDSVPLDAVSKVNWGGLININVMRANPLDSCKSLRVLSWSNVSTSTGELPITGVGRDCGVWL